MMKRLFAVIACLSFGTGGLSAPNSSTDVHVLARPYSQFGFDVLRELASKRSDENLFISPTSIAVALAMTSNGANGATRDAILRTLHSDTQAVEAFSAGNRALSEQIANTKAVQLFMANALWLQSGLPVNPSFAQTLQAAYSAQAGNLDFRSSSAAQTINAWVARHTNDRIQKMSRNT
jgi:serpin B